MVIKNQNGLEYIENNNKVIAIILSTEFKSEGINFFTSDDFTQQLGYMKHPKNYIILPHVHNAVPREINFTKEVLFIKSGKIRVDFYDDNQKYLESRILKKGDVILLAFGSHGFEMLEPSEMIEVKQGPYVGEKDKTRFEPATKDEIKVKD